MPSLGSISAPRGLRESDLYAESDLKWVFRLRWRSFISGKNMTEFNTFSALELPEPILRAISEMGYTNPTPIQQQAIPALLEHKNVLGEA